MNGFSIFDSIHIMWLIFIAVFLVISLYFYHYSSNGYTMHLGQLDI